MKTAKSATNWQVYLRLLKSTQAYWFCFVIGIVATICAVATDAGLSWAIKPFIDVGLVARDKTLLSWLPLIIISAFVVRSVAYFLSNYYVTRVGRSVVMDYRQRIFSHLMHLPASFYDKESSGKLLSLVIYNTEQIATATTEALLTVLQEGLMLIGIIIVMLFLSWQLTLFFMLTAPIVALIMRYNSRRLRMLSANVQRSVGDVSHVAEESIEGYRVVRIFGGEEYEKQKFNTAAFLNRYREMKVVVTNSLGSSYVQIVVALPIAVIVYMATLPSLHVSVGSFGAIVAAMVRLLTPMKRLTRINTDIQKGIAGAHSIFELLDTPTEKDVGKVLVNKVKGKIEYKNVSFAYQKSFSDVLQNISFTVEPGETVALVGRSGGGKSTIISLLPRFYDVNSGNILIDNININDYKLKDLRKQFAVVSQHLTLFNDTIAQNIAYGVHGKISENKIIEVAEIAHIMDFIRQLPEGLNTLIGENGLLLSGGQRQRIAIARALLKDAPILILDEATSALDTESEYHIQAALTELMRRRTTLVIAHRLSTIESANKILVIEQGSIVEMGTHQELLSKEGVYAKLYKMQFKDN